MLQTLLLEIEGDYFNTDTFNRFINTQVHEIFCLYLRFLPWLAVIWESHPGSGWKAPPSCPSQTSMQLFCLVYCSQQHPQLLKLCPGGEPHPVVGKPESLGSFFNISFPARELIQKHKGLKEWVRAYREGKVEDFLDEVGGRNST